MAESNTGPVLKKSYRTFLIAAAVFLLCAILLGLQAKSAGPLPGDLEFTHFVQGLLPYDGFITLLWKFMGGALRYSPYLVLAVTLGLRKWDWAILVAVACLPMGLFGEAQLKPLFSRSRPATDLVHIYQVSKGLSFPSGTALNAMTLTGVVLYLARLAGKSWIATLVIVLALLFLLLTNLARIHVGAHWATDILGGWLFGSAWVALWLAAHQWWLSQDSGSQYAEKE